MSRVTETSLEMGLSALGSEEGAEAERLAERLRAHPGLAGLEAEWAETLAGLANGVPEVAAPDGLMDRIDAALDVECAPETRTVRAEAGPWRERSAGVWIKLLDKDEETGIGSYLLRCEAGSAIPTHRHARSEHVFVIEGSISFGDLLLRAGDYHVAKQGSEHPIAKTTEGCLVLVRC